MIAKKITKADLPQVQSLWKEVFPEDSDAFLSWYFRCQYRPENSYGVWEKNQLFSMGTLAAYKINLRGKVFPANFFQGIATKKKAQGRGYGGFLVQTMLQDLAEKGQAVAALNTMVHPFYRKYGFETYAYQKSIPFSGDQKTEFAVLSHWQEATDSVLKKMLLLYQKEMQGKSGFIARTLTDMRRIATDYLQFSGAKLILAEKEYAFVLFQNGQWESPEAVCFDGLFRGLRSFIRYMSGEICRVQCCRETGQEFAMLRIIQMQKAWEGIRLGKGSCVLNVQDDLLLQNQGCWKLESDGSQTKICRTRQFPDLCLSVQQAAQVLAGNGGMIDAKWKTMFSPCQTVIFEQY